MQWLDAGGHAYRYRLDGPAAAQTPLVVLLHEAGGSIESWDGLLAGWPTSQRVLCYDQRGFGLSEKVRDLSIDTMVADLIAVLDALGERAPVHLVGSAIGGSIALAAAAAHPDRVASVVANSPVTGPAPASAQVPLMARAEKVLTEGMRAVADTALARSYPPEFRDPQTFERFRRRYLCNDPVAFAAMTRVFCVLDLPPLYPKVRCPTLIVGCTFDVIKSPASCREIVQALPAGHYVEIDACHFLALQAPDKMRAAVLDFLSRQHAND